MMPRGRGRQSRPQERRGGEIGPPIVSSIEIEDFNLQEVQQPYDLNNLRSISSSGDGKCRSYLIMILKIYF